MPLTLINYEREIPRIVRCSRCRAEVTPDWMETWQRISVSDVRCTPHTTFFFCPTCMKTAHHALTSISLPHNHS